MIRTLRTVTNTENIVLAVLDKETEILREVESQDLILPVFAKNMVIKRFFLIGEALYNSNLTVTANTSTDEYTVKVAIGLGNIVRYSDFAEYTNSFTTQYNNTVNSYMNALPVDICITSNKYSIEDTELSITIKSEGI